MLKLFTALSSKHNYFNGPKKLFSNLFLAKFLDHQNCSFPEITCLNNIIQIILEKYKIYIRRKKR